MSGVHARVGKAGGNSDVHGMLDEKLLQFVERLLDRVADGRGCEAKFHFVGVQLRHLGGFAYQAVQPVAFLVDDGQQFLSFFVMPANGL